MLIDTYNDGTADLWRPKFRPGGVLEFNKLSLNNTTFTRTKMGEIFGRNIKLVQFDAPPFSYVKNKELIGVEGKLLDVFCERQNLTYEIVNENTEKYSPNELIGRFQTLNADLSLTTKFQLNTKIWFVDFNHLYINDGLCMLVPRNIPVSSFENFDYPFDYKISICLLVTSCLIIITWKGISMAVHSGFSIHFIIFSVFRYLMGNSATGENRMTFKEKIVVYGYVIVAMVLMALYESFVISFMMTDPTYKSVQSFHELNESNTKIFQYFEGIEDVIFKDELILNKVNLLNDHIVFIPKDFDHNLAYVTTCQYADAFIRSSRNFNKDNKRLFDKLDEKITFYDQSYPISNLFPLKKEFEHFVSVLRESGLRDFWVRSEVENLKVIEEDEKSVLNFDDMKIPFIILGTGLTLSFLVFLIELTVNNIKQRRNNRVIYL